MPSSNRSSKASRTRSVPPRHACTPSVRRAPPPITGPAKRYLAPWTRLREATQPKRRKSQHMSVRRPPSIEWTTHPSSRFMRPTAATADPRPYALSSPVTMCLEVRLTSPPPLKCCDMCVHAPSYLSLSAVRQCAVHWAALPARTSRWITTTVTSDGSWYGHENLCARSTSSDVIDTKSRLRMPARSTTADPATA